MQTWVVPGAPLTDGSGWRVWYAVPGRTAPEPAPVTVQRGGTDAEILSQNNERLVGPESLNRTLYIKTIQLSQPVPGRLYTVRVPELGAARTWRTFPNRLTADGVRFVFASCFWRDDDKEGFYHRAVDAVLRSEHKQVAFKLLAGDQIYLDFPVPNPLRQVTDMVARRYRAYWGDVSYRRMLDSTPNFFLCDDHEWWNDYPEPQKHLPHTYRRATRVQYGLAATEYYNLFQRRLTPGRTPWFRFDIDPVSFFFADTRSARDSVSRANKTPQFMQDDQWAALEAWQHGLRGPGILVTGMPLMQKDGDWKDHTLGNFPEDNWRLMQLFTRSLTGRNAEGRPHDIVILSGDIHTGRHCVARLTAGADLAVHELIASPASRVGPFLSEPTPSRSPERLPQSGFARWANRVDTLFEHVANNIGLIRLFPSGKGPGRVRLEFTSYLVRPHRRPSWKFWASDPAPDFTNPQSLRLNTGSAPLELR